MHRMYKHRNKHEIAKLKKKQEKIMRRRRLGRIQNRIIKFGYMTMLTFRLIGEFIFLYLEKELAKHQSQQALFWESFDLSESWLCATNDNGAASKRSLDRMIP